MSCKTGANSASAESCPLVILRKLGVLRQQPEPKKYPAVSSIPLTSPARLAQAAEDYVEDRDHPTPNTYLYLAYGSNLAAETFLGVRGIRPLSQVNVSVPTLELKFNLPGIPYREPCFANVDYRKLPDKPKLPPKLPPKIPPFDPPQPPRSQATWDEGLMGVVYEVTEEDYGTIIRTEGGGVGYKEIVAPCLPIPPKISIPEKPFPEIPKPFLARTLFAPQIPEPELPDDPRKKKWWYRFLIGPHRDPDYSQASARYLNLIRDGAKEHELPDGYQRWLQSLQEYTITSWRQRVGAALFLLMSGFIFLLIMIVSKMFANKDGKVPHWLGLIITVMFNLTWMGYDGFFKPVFGDGERTEETDEHKGHRRKSSLSALLKRYPQVDEEKVVLLTEFE
ncbi:hypothetical protein FALBO_6225 [Fusarium albosuccineum]|uniref:gamma-glutamylcyclotransferase n=1 Tax=Fusarium albosuccineum TaxID=1237068 RepID=A0A8H4LEM2_9HYPO|nr:hypothetical protein FALBO_6225 [Fusarium albosuccineum]